MKQALTDDLFFLAGWGEGGLTQTREMNILVNAYFPDELYLLQLFHLLYLFFLSTEACYK